MEKTARAELIAALVTDKHSGFADGDEAILEAASDERLERFRSAADASRRNRDRPSACPTSRVHPRLLVFSARKAVLRSGCASPPINGGSWRA